MVLKIKTRILHQHYVWERNYRDCMTKILHFYRYCNVFVKIYKFSIFTDFLSITFSFNTTSDDVNLNGVIVLKYISYCGILINTYSKGIFSCSNRKLFSFIYLNISFSSRVRHNSFSTLVSEPLSPS